VPDAIAGILCGQQSVMCPSATGWEDDHHVPIRWVGELDLERFVCCRSSKHQLLSSFPEGRAAFSAVKVWFGLPLDTRRGGGMPVYWH